MVICFVGSAELLHGEKRFPPPHRRRVGGIQVKREALEKTGERCVQGGETYILCFSWPSAEAVCLPISPFDKGGTDVNKGEEN